MAGAAKGTLSPKLLRFSSRSAKKAGAREKASRICTLVRARLVVGRAMAEADQQPFYRTGPDRPALPVLLSVPHAGRDYSPALLAAARVPRATLEALEDRLMDRLVWRAAAAGCAAIVARAPRAEIDLNRDEREIDPAAVSPPLPSRGLVQSARTRGGLGLVPTRLAGAGPLWQRRLAREELERRIAAVHRPYHAALAAALAETRDRFGVAVLLDCHSMPPRPGGGGAPVIFGDRHGTSCAPLLVEAAAAAAEALGFRTARNHPYAGGHIVAAHGRPEAGIHAVQIELDRSLYLGAGFKEPGPGFDTASRMIEAVALALARAAEPPQAIAAE
jgi:N-formylglutamate amidohydrolase